jgi:hypothetical protein
VDGARAVRPPRPLARSLADPLVLQVPRGGAVHRQMDIDAPPEVTGGQVVVEALPTDAHGHLEPPDVGEVVLSVPSPETLTRERDQLRRVIAAAGPGVEPLVMLVEAAEELREEELEAVLHAAQHTTRPLIMRVLRDA